MTAATVARLREVCLALPEAEERAMFDHPAFRVCDKIFAMHAEVDLDEKRRPTVWCKAPPGSQRVLVNADPTRFFAPRYVGPKGWVGVRLDRRPNWAEVAVIVRRSYRLVAPRRLAERISGD